MFVTTDYVKYSLDSTFAVASAVYTEYKSYS